MYPTVHVPVYGYHNDIVVYPLPYQIERKVNLINVVCFILSIYTFQGTTFFYLLTEGEYFPVKTQHYHWLEYLPNHVYCFLQSPRSRGGSVKMFTKMPGFLQQYHWIELSKVSTLQVFKQYYLH